MRVPRSLRTWFFIHFVVDMLFGLPLLFAPAAFMGFFGFTAELMTTRLVGAALLGIGSASFFMRSEGKAVYDTMLRLKIVWSLAAILGIGITIFEGAPISAWLFLILFTMFSGVWIYYKKRL